MDIRAENLRVGDRVLDSEHATLVGGTVTSIEEAFAHLYKVVVTGAHNINHGGKMTAIITSGSTFVVDR